MNNDFADQARPEPPEPSNCIKTYSLAEVAAAHGLGEVSVDPIPLADHAAQPRRTPRRQVRTQVAHVRR